MGGKETKTDMLNYWQFWKRPTIKTSSDLAQVKVLNTKGITVAGDALPNFSELITSDQGFGWLGTGISFSLISNLKNWHVSQFEYKNLPQGIDSDYIEFLLFVWGKAVIFKIADKYYTTSFVATKYDIYFNPTEVRVIVPFDENHKLHNRKFKVGVNCAIIYNDQSYVLGNKVFYGTLWRVWPYIQAVVKSHKLILRNQNLTKKWIKMPYDTDIENIDIITKLIENDEQMVLPLTQNFLMPSQSTGRTRDNEDKLEFDDYTGQVWDNYFNHLDLLKNAIGMESNSNSKKRERQITDEISVNNAMADGVKEILWKTRQKGLDTFNEIFQENVVVQLRKPDEQESEFNDDEKQN